MSHLPEKTNWPDLGIFQKSVDFLKLAVI